ncbi:MAG TPA: tetratricopeptide repeat protein [Drouetiella sp.]
MRSNRKFTRSAICLAQTVLLLAGNASLSFAAGTSSSTSLDTFEKSVFGEAHSKLSESERLKDLETNLFGKVHTGSTATRISEISKALGGAKNDNLLLPALAPQLDTSSSHPISAAPSAYGDPDATDPVITASGDSEKDALRKAMSLYSQGKVDDAEKQFRKVLSINKNSVDAYYNLGVIAEGRGDLQNALNNYRSAARINPIDTELASTISSLETKLQDKVNSDNRQRQEQAIAAQDQQKTDNLKSMINQAATAYKGGDYDKAISNLTYVSRQAPTDSDVQYALGQAYKGKGDYAHARNAYNSAIAIDPSNSLYKDALAGLNNSAGSSASAGGYGGGPAPAPDRKHGGKAGQLTSFTGNSGGYGGSNSGGYGSDSSLSSNANSGGTAGTLTPFSGVANGATSGPRFDDEFSNNTSGGMSGYASSSGMPSVRYSRSGLGGLGSLGGIGLSMLGGSMLGGGVRYNGGYSGSYYGRSGFGGYGGYGGGSSTRIKRAAIGGLTGAAAGALYGGMSHGSMKSSAMTGALMGTALGLFMGGY